MAPIEIRGSVLPECREILTPEALNFIAELAREFSCEREKLLLARRERQQELRRGARPDFLPETAHIREATWRVAPPPKDLEDRRVEITGPAGNRKMVINAMNSGASVFMADAEDSESPTWRNILNGQLNLRDAIRRTISYATPEKKYQLNKQAAVLMFRPRGWHLEERHVFIDGKPVPASIFDAGLYLFHNARELLERGTGPYLYLPKLESRLEAGLWNALFRFAEDALCIPRGSVRPTVLIETILAAFEMDEVLWELRERSAGLNCGRWDYIFSFIKKFSHDPSFLLPDRSLVTMDKGFLKSYVDLLIQTCHRRGAHAMGGMAAQIPIKNDPEANERALEKVRQDKLREARAGHDGTWVAHPGLVGIAREIFDAHMPGPNQLYVMREDVRTSAADLLAVPQGEITLAGLETNCRVGTAYLSAWLGGNGCVPINNLMEDAATAEISRSQLWQQVRHGARLADGEDVTPELVRRTMKKAGAQDTAARDLFLALTFADECAEFLTLPAYDILLKREQIHEL